RLKERFMIEEPARLRLARDLRRPTEAQIAALTGHPTGFVLDAMFGAGAMWTAISPLPGVTARVCGPALVAGNGPGDILGSLAAVRFVRPGDVVVTEAQGYQGCAAGGDRLCGFLRNRGAAALVTDGPLRDLEGLHAVGLPAWCTGLIPGSPVVRGPATVGLPINVGGQRVEQGDVVVADGDGVVVVPFALLDAVAATLIDVARAEETLDAEVAAGLDVVDAVEAVIESEDGVEWV
ncbi:MAG: RraA family protein, partial [Pseudomonadota bacterium]